MVAVDEYHMGQFRRIVKTVVCAAWSYTFPTAQNRDFVRSFRYSRRDKT